MCKAGYTLEIKIWKLLVIANRKYIMSRGLRTLCNGPETPTECNSLRKVNRNEPLDVGHDMVSGVGLPRKRADKTRVTEAVSPLLPVLPLTALPNPTWSIQPPPNPIWSIQPPPPWSTPASTAPLTICNSMQSSWFPCCAVLKLKLQSHRAWREDKSSEKACKICIGTDDRSIFNLFPFQICLACF